MAQHWAAPQLVGGNLNFDLNHLLRAPPPILAALLVRRLVDADLELASAAGRAPLCSYQGPEGTRPSRINGLLVDTRLVALLRTAKVLPRGAIPGHTPVRFNLHLRGASQRVVLGRTGARVPAASCVGAPPPGPAPDTGHPPLPFLAPSRGVVPSHLRGSGGRGRWPCLPRGDAGRLHGAGEVAATRPHGGGLVDGGAGVLPWDANPFGVHPLQGCAAAKPLAALAGKVRLVVAGKFPIIP